MSAPTAQQVKARELLRARILASLLAVPTYRPADPYVSAHGAR